MVICTGLILSGFSSLAWIVLRVCLNLDLLAESAVLSGSFCLPESGYACYAPDCICLLLFVNLCLDLPIESAYVCSSSTSVQISLLFFLERQVLRISIWSCFSKKWKVIGSDSPRSKWVMRDMIMSSKHGDKVLIAQPVVTDKAPVVKDKAPVVADKALIVANKHKADVVKLSNVVADKLINVVVADNADVGKALGKKSIVGKDTGLSDILKYKPKNNAPKVVKERRKTELLEEKPKNNAPVVFKERRKTELPKDNPKNKSKAHSEVPVAEKSIVVSEKSKPNPKHKSKETPVKRKMILLKEDDRKKKCKENIKRLLNKLKKKAKKEESDEEIIPKKEIWFSLSQNVTIDKIPSKLGGPVGNYSLIDLEEKEVDHEFIRLWIGQFYPKPLKDIQVNDIASKLVVAQEFDFLFNFNVLTLFTNTMGMSDGLKDQICLDVVRHLRGDFLELKDHLLGILELHSDRNEAEGEETEGFTGDLKTYKKKPKGKESGLALEGLICLTKTTSMTILDNSRATYDSKYKEVCDLLNYGLPVELQLQYDMLRRLRFKFSTKILLHEVNVHAKKKLDLAKEFDKVDANERMSIIVEVIKKKEERDRI
nr:hypothetical protein [Tanacetum cinerariifolium]